MGLQLSSLSKRRGAVTLIAGFLLFFFVALCYRAADDASAAFDEPVHILAGYSYWTKGVPETTSGNLRAAQLWLALPLLPLELHYPEVYRNTPGLVGDADLGVLRDFMHDAPHDAATLLRLSRAAITLLGVILGIVLFCWSRRLHGDAAALITLGLYCFEPTIIAHSSLATTDIAATLMFTLALVTWWRLLHHVSVSTVALCGLASGLLATTKISAVLLAPAVAIMLIVRFGLRRELTVRWPWTVSSRSPQFWRPILIATFGALSIAYATIWTIYGLRYTHGRILPEPAWSSLLGPQAMPVQHVLNMLRLHHLLPEAYLYDLISFLNNLEGRRAYLLGGHSVEGWWNYFPVAWLTKTSLPTLIALSLSAAAAGLAFARRRQSNPVDFYPLAPLVSFALIYVGSAVNSPMNIGIRHLLPIYPTLLVFAGLSVRLLPDSAAHARGLLVAGLIFWSAAVAWTASPFFLSYFNPGAGGTKTGHRILVESNYDWGQDLPKVARWLKERAAAPAYSPDPVFFSYYGLGKPASYGITATLLPQEPDFRQPSIYDLVPGTYVISATMLQALGGHRVWGPWRPSLERAYRALSHELGPLYARPTELTTVPSVKSEELEQKVALYDELRFARLCAYLRPRPPTAQITPAMLVYTITEEDLSAALIGALPLAAEPAIKGLSRWPMDRFNFLR